MASHRRPAPEGTDPRTHTPALQRRNTLRVTSKATYEGRATEQCGLTPTPSVCMACHPWEIAHSANKQAISQSIDDGPQAQVPLKMHPSLTAAEELGML